MQSLTGLPSACSCHLLQRWERDISFWLPKPHPRMLPLYKEAKANLFPNTTAQLISLLRSLCSLPCPSTSSPHCWCLITSMETCFPCSPHKRWLFVSFNGPWVPGPGGRGHNYSCSPSLSYTLLFPFCLQISLLCQSSRLPPTPLQAATVICHAHTHATKWPLHFHSYHHLSTEWTLCKWHLSPSCP